MMLMILCKIKSRLTNPDKIYYKNPLRASLARFSFFRSQLLLEVLAVKLILPNAFSVRLILKRG